MQDVSKNARSVKVLFNETKGLRLQIGKELWTPQLQLTGKLMHGRRVWFLKTNLTGGWHITTTFSVKTKHSYLLGYKSALDKWIKKVNLQPNFQTVATL